MSEFWRQHPTAFVHIGTHKTGTTSIQELLTRNDRTLRQHGVLVPKSCRIGRHSGHHNLAWELSGDPRYDPRFGRLDGMLAEIRASRAPNVCISSEDLELLHGDTNALERLRNGLLDAGYAPAIILYLRPQADYIESAYAEILKARAIRFDDFLESILTRGRYGELLFNYDLLAGRFAHVFGRSNMIVRTYESHRPNMFLLDEFLGIVAPELARSTRLAIPARLNPMSERFVALTSPDIARIGVAFELANERLRAAFGITVDAATEAIVNRERGRLEPLECTVQGAAG